MNRVWRAGVVCTLALAVAGGPTPARPSQGGPAPYRLTRTPLANDSLLLRVYRRDARRPVFQSGSIEETERIAWSGRRGELAYEDSNRRRIVVWRAGHKMRQITDQALLHWDGDFNILQLAWSPDGRRLLIRATGGNGNASVDLGGLWCYRVQDGRLQESDTPEGGVEPAQWVGRRRIRYTECIPPRTIEPDGTVKGQVKFITRWWTCR